MMIMRKIFLIVLASLFAIAETPDVVNKCTSNYLELKKEQIEALTKAYYLGEGAGYGYLMSAIAWQESCAGEVKVNFQDPSAGLFHAYLPNVIDRHPSLKKSGLNANIIGQMLVEDDEFSAREAIAELDMWKKVNKGDTKGMIKSYNKGNSWKSSHDKNALAEKYYSSVSQKMETLKKMLVLSAQNPYADKMKQKQDFQAQATNSANKQPTPAKLNMPIYTSATRVLTPKPQPAIIWVPKKETPKVAMNSKPLNKARLLYE